MKREFFKHLRVDPKDPHKSRELGSGTLCVIYDEENDKFFAGVSLCHTLDQKQFNRKLGCMISRGRAESMDDKRIIPFRSFGEIVHRNEDTSELEFYSAQENLSLLRNNPDYEERKKAYYKATYKKEENGKMIRSDLDKNWHEVQDGLKNFLSSVKLSIENNKKKSARVCTTDKSGKIVKPCISAARVVQ